MKYLPVKLCNANIDEDLNAFISFQNTPLSQKEAHEIIILLKIMKTKHLNGNSVSINVRLMKHVFLKISNR